jgi:hypothetical protein
VFGRSWSSRSSFEQASEERDDQEGEKNEEQYLCYTGRGASNAAETKRTGYDRHDQKYERPVEHDPSPSNAAVKTWFVAVCSTICRKRRSLEIIPARIESSRPVG